MASNDRSAEIRARLDHPVVDTDGHLIEATPVLLDYIARVGGRNAAEQYAALPNVKRQFALPGHDAYWVEDPAWWVWPTRNTLDRATATLPKLLHARLDEFGFDFCILYPSEGLFLFGLEDDELRQVCCRAYNMFVAERYREYASRITPAAIIPMNTPEEAVAELRFAVGELGLKVVVLRGFVRRNAPDPGSGADRESLDFFGLGSPFDYDPVWATCQELKVAATFHSSAIYGSRDSIPNYVYNHIGALGQNGADVCKALFMGGVTRRFPELNIAFLEGGVGWACNLYADLISHWSKRNERAVENYNPENLDLELMLQLLREYGDPAIEGRLDEMREIFERRQPPVKQTDNYAAARIMRSDEIRDLFVPRFYFGCEADDPINLQAYDVDVNPFGAKLRTVLGSDIGHWDVVNMEGVLEEAYEPVERGLVSAADFHDFVFANAVRLHGGMNRDFFEGTVVENAAGRLLDEAADAA